MKMQSFFACLLALGFVAPSLLSRKSRIKGTSKDPGVVSGFLLRAVEPTLLPTPTTPLPGIDQCDCRIQLLDALRLEIQGWTIGNAPDVEAWMDEAAAWIVELPTNDLFQGWIAMMTFELSERLGVPVNTVSRLLQEHVGKALIKKEAKHDRKS